MMSSLTDSLLKLLEDLWMSTIFKGFLISWFVSWMVLRIIVFMIDCSNPVTGGLYDGA